MKLLLTQIWSAVKNYVDLAFIFLVIIPIAVILTWDDDIWNEVNEY